MQAPWWDSNVDPQVRQKYPLRSASSVLDRLSRGVEPSVDSCVVSVAFACAVVGRRVRRSAARSRRSGGNRLERGVSVMLERGFRSSVFECASGECENVDHPTPLVRNLPALGVVGDDAEVGEFRQVDVV